MKTKTAEEITTTLTTCPGKIDALGYCNHCGQRSQLSGSNCFRLIPILPLEQQKTKTAEEILKECAPTFNPNPMIIAAMKRYAEQAIDKCAEEVENHLFGNPLTAGSIRRIKKELK